MKLATLLLCLTFSLITPIEKTLFKLEQGEYIVSNESQLKASIAGGGFSIVTKKAGKFYVYTEKGKLGPFDKLPPEHLPASGIRKNDSYIFEDPGTKDGKPEMGMAANGGMTIKLDNKVIATLPPGEIPAGVAVDKQKNRLAYMTMTAEDNGNLVFAVTQTPSGKKILIKDAMLVQIKQNDRSGSFIYEAMAQDGQKMFYSESGEKMGPFSNDASAFELYDKSVVVMDPVKGQQNASIIKNGKTIHSIKNGNPGMPILFNSDASKYLVVSSGGLEFSDGSKVATGILPTIEKTASGTNLHYLRINENKEVILTTVPW